MQLFDYTSYKHYQIDISYNWPMHNGKLIYIGLELWFCSVSQSRWGLGVGLGRHRSHVEYVNSYDFTPHASALFPAPTCPYLPLKSSCLEFVFNMIHNPSQWVHLEHIVTRATPSGGGGPQNTTKGMFCPTKKRKNGDVTQDRNC